MGDRKCSQQPIQKTAILIGGSHKEGSELCFSVIDGIVKAERLLECAHKEDDDRLLFHVNHAAKVAGFGSVAVTSPDTDIFVSAIYHFSKLMYFDLKELWLVLRQNEVVPIHDLVDVMEPDL